MYIFMYVPCVHLMCPNPYVKYGRTRNCRSCTISQMDVNAPHNLYADDLDLASSITGLYRILELATDEGSGGLGTALCHGKKFLTHTCPS